MWPVWNKTDRKDGRSSSKLDKICLFTRPRRFGKSLNMDMLKSFFEIGCDRSLFDGRNSVKAEKMSLTEFLAFAHSGRGSLVMRKLFQLLSIFCNASQTDSARHTAPWRSHTGSQWTSGYVSLNNLAYIRI